MSTYRERRGARAEKLREWADKRQERAAATFKADRVYTSDHAFNTQPGHIPIRAKVIAREGRAFESIRKADGMNARADGIESQLAGAIYSDDADAIPALEARIATLEAERETKKARNAAYRKEHGAELRAMTPYERSQAVPYPSYHLQNLGGNITRNRKRLEQLKRQGEMVAAGDRGYGKPMDSRYAGTCPDCGQPIERGDPILYYRLTREAVHANCEVAS